MECFASQRRANERGRARRWGGVGGGRRRLNRGDSLRQLPHSLAQLVFHVLAANEIAADRASHSQRKNQNKMEWPHGGRPLESLPRFPLARNRRVYSNGRAAAMRC